MEEIRIGLKANLDVSWYAKKDFYSFQMKEIRWGLENNLNVSIYAKPEFDYLQMKEIRLGLEKINLKPLFMLKQYIFLIKLI